MLVQADEEEEHGTAQHPDCVAGGVTPVPAPQLRHHGDQGHVEEHAHCARQQPRGEITLGTEEEADNKTNEGEHAGDAVVEDGNLDAHAGVEQQGKVPDLVGQLVAEDGDAGGEAGGEAHREGGAHCESVSKVVNGVTDNDHQGGGGHLAARLPG